MATQIVETLECDIAVGKTEHEATMTVSWSFDGVNYELELCEAHREAMGKAMAKYLAASRIVRPHSTPTWHRRRQAASTNGTGYRTAEERQHSAEVREWARQNGHTVSNRGRLPVEIEKLYEQSVRQAS